MSQVIKKIDIRQIPNWDHAEQYHTAWNALVTCVFQTYEWNQAWWQSFGAGHELLLLGAFEDSSLVGIAPFMITHQKFPVPRKTIRFIGSMNYASDYCSFITRPDRGDVLNAFGTWLDSHPELWNELDFFNMVEGSPELAIFQSRFNRNNRSRFDLRYLCDAPTRFLGNPEEDKDLVNRKSLKRHFNWFKNQGELSFGHLEQKKEILGQLDQFFEQHIGRRSVTEDASQFLDPRQKVFYQSLVETMAPQGWLKFFAVHLNGVPIAYHIGFEFSGKFYWYKPTFDIQYIKKSPGEVLLKTLFEYAIDRKLAEFDFTVGNEAFKYRFSNHVRKLYRFRAFRTWAHYALFKTQIQSRALVRRVLKPQPLPSPTAS